MLLYKISTLKLQQKMYLLLALVLAGYAVISLACIQTNQSRTEASAEIRQAEKLAFLVKSTEALLLRCRRHEQQFRLDNQWEQVERFDEEAATLDQLISETRLPAEHFGMGTDMTEILQLIDTYISSFHHIAGLRREIGLNADSGLHGKLRNAAGDAEEIVKAQMQDDLMVVMMKIRYQEELFLAHPDEENMKKILDLHSMFTSRLEYSDIPENSRAYVQKSMASYLDNFTAMADRTLEAEKSTAEFNNKASTAETRMQEMLDRIPAITEKAVQQGAQAYQLANYVFAGTVIIAIILITSAVFIILRSIHLQLGADPAAVAEIAGKIAQGNLNAMQDAAGSVHVGVMASMQLMRNALDSIVSDIQHNAETVAADAVALLVTADNIQSATEEQAASIEQTSTSTEEIRAATRQNAENAQYASRMADESREAALACANAVSETTEAIRLIARKISVIGEIAAQTKLLSLNADIEASRAGEQGRGFAVVAREVRKLAELSRAAADEIGDITARGSSLADQSQEALGRMLPKTIKSSELIREITLASMEQSSGTEQITSALSHLDYSAQQNAGAAQQLAATAKALQERSACLQQGVAFFQTGH